MSDDTTTAGDRLDQAIDAAKQMAADLRAKLGTAAAGAADEIGEAVDALSAKLDELQAAWVARRDADSGSGQSQSQ